MSHQIMTPEQIAELRKEYGSLEGRIGKTVSDLREILDALESAQKEIADLKRGGVVVPGAARTEIIRELILEIEDTHFRTIHDTGANEKAQMILDCLRRKIGLPYLSIKDLPAPIGKVYVTPKDSNLLREIEARGAEKSRLRPIPADRELREGQVAVDQEELGSLRHLLDCARVAAHAVEDEGECDMSSVCGAVFACDSLRAQPTQDAAT